MILTTINVFLKHQFRWWFSSSLISFFLYRNMQMLLLLRFPKSCFKSETKKSRKKNKLNNKLININKAKRQQQQQQVKNVYFYRFCCFVVRFAACRNLYPRDTYVHVCAYVYLYHPSVCYSYSWKHVNGIRCMQSTLEVHTHSYAREYLPDTNCNQV